MSSSPKTSGHWRHGAIGSLYRVHPPIKRGTHKKADSGAQEDTGGFGAGGVVTYLKISLRDATIIALATGFWCVAANRPTGVGALDVATHLPDSPPPAPPS